MNFHLSPYRPSMERSWLRCRVLSFLETAYFDDVIPKKPSYENPSVELVAQELTGKVIGLIDLEINRATQSGMIHHLAVHPDYQGTGIGGALLEEATRLAQEQGATRLEAWTRDDVQAREWYLAQGFAQFHSYLHVWMNMESLCTEPHVDRLRVLSGFAHYTGQQPDEIRKRFGRVHECVGFEKNLPRI